LALALKVYSAILYLGKYAKAGHGMGNTQSAILTRLANGLTVRFNPTTGKIRPPIRLCGRYQERLRHRTLVLFLFQHLPMLNFQQYLKWKYNRSNAEVVLDVQEIPSNNHITRLLDNLEPEWFVETFNNNFLRMDELNEIIKLKTILILTLKIVYTKI
jgi:hypothetical protein